MNSPKAVVAMVGIALIIAVGAMAGRTVNAAEPTVSLGMATSFSVLAHTTVTNTGLTTLNRDLGIDAPLASITGFPPGLVGGATHAGDGVAGQAKLDLTAAYVDAAGRGSSATYGDLVGLTVVGGVYTLSSLTSDLTGDLTLNGQFDPNSVWIFKSPSTLITSSTSRVLLINGASPCNVFWQVSSSATLGTGSTFVGTILAHTSIGVTTGVTVDGRALADTGAVTLDADTFISSACQPVLIPPTRPPFTIAPSATPTATPTVAAVATATPSGAPTATPTSSTTPAAAATPGPTTRGVQVLPSTSTGDPMNPLFLFAIGLAGFGAMLLIRQLKRRHL